MLKNISLWIIASSLLTQTAFTEQMNPCDCKPVCPQPAAPTQACDSDPCCPAWNAPLLRAAYNYSGRIETRNPINIFFDASFTYLQPVQENMELGILDSSSSNLNGPIINLNARYKPGFKVGVGRSFDLDDWDWHGQYSWFHCSQHKTEQASNDGVSSILPMWGSPSSVANEVNLGGNVYFSAQENWRLMMDIGEIDLGRKFYVGKNLLFRPNIGIRGVWLKQRLNTTYLNPSTFALGTTDTNTITGKIRSWSAGIKTGLDTDWKMGAGFKLYSSAETDLLFTNYTQLSYKCLHVLSPASAAGDVVIKQKRVYAIKPHIDLELGIGWSTYLDCNNWYLDFAAGYDFQVFFDQNMFRHFDDNSMAANSVSPFGNLYLQGFTLKASATF
jgi:hypothetical protein